MEKKIKVKLNLKDGSFLTGFIISVVESELIFEDKFNNEVLIDINSISYVIPVGGMKNG
jgi:hypothetical protein